ncbi:hypothetical protein MMC21_006703 [Puttea exsequens]|nr:hypothetical protein [Puttea exsequens]
MPEPNWKDVDAVRYWLEARYPTANAQIGSPYFQHLKEEQAKGHSINGRERHLSGGVGGEFQRWVWDNDDGSTIYYSADRMRVTYYPEYVNELSSQGSQSPTQAGAIVENNAPGLTRGLRAQHENSGQFQKQAKPRRKNAKNLHKNTIMTPPSLRSGNPKTIKKSRRDKQPGVSNREASQQIDTKMLDMQKNRMSTLRPTRNRQHPKTGKTKVVLFKKLYLTYK